MQGFTPPHGYRPEIDGMRAIAVILVMLFHAGLSGFEGGYIGVDVFFVISGYLITRLILDDLRAGRFSMARFYERRARRILPALFVMIVLIIPPSLWLMVPFQVRDFGQSIVAVTFFASNFLFWRQSGYFEPEAESKPLLHTWSLANEEQFYILFPLILLLLWRFSRGNPRPIIAVLVVMTLASLAYAEYASRHFPLANFYLLPGRAWEMLAGALCAFALSRNTVPALPYATVLGTAMILMSAFLFDADTPFPSLYTVIPILGTMLIILDTRPGSRAAAFLASGPMRGIGLISYSAYLWHMPFLAFLNIHFFGEAPLWMRLAAVALSLPVAWLSWLLIEKPCRDRNRMSFGRLGLLGTVMIVPVVVFGLGAHFNAGYRDIYLARLSPEAATLAIDRDAEVATRGPIWSETLADATRPFDPDGGRRVLILGDSLSGDLFVAMDRQPYMGVQFRRKRLNDTCMPAFLTGSGSDRCLGEAERLRASGLLEDADEIVLAANWDPRTWRHGVATAEYLLNPGRQLSIQGLAAFNDMASVSFRIGEFEDRVPELMFQNLRSRFLNVNDDLKAALSDRDDIRYLDKLALLCDRAAQECDMLAPSGRPMIYDSAHMTVEAIDIFGVRIRDAGWFK